MGEVQNGERVYGLRRALVLADAQTQLASLWKVVDTATKDLMLDYYQRLLRRRPLGGAARFTKSDDRKQKPLAPVLLCSLCPDWQLGTAARGTLTRQPIRRRSHE